VRKLLLYGFLGLMCYHLIGFFTYFEWKRYHVRKEVKHIIKHSVPETQLVHFHFTHHELHQLKWVKSHEFILNGHYYDVIHKKQDSNGCFFQCIRDDQETQLFAQLSSMTSFNLSHSGEQHPVNVWFKFISEPMEVVTLSEIDLICYLETSKSPIKFMEQFTSIVLVMNDPPPKWFS